MKNKLKIIGILLFLISLIPITIIAGIIDILFIPIYILNKKPDTNLCNYIENLITRLKQYVEKIEKNKLKLCQSRNIERIKKRNPKREVKK